MSLYDAATDKWENFNIPNGLADAFVYDVLKASNGDVWIATWSGANRIRGGDLKDRSKWDVFTVENTKGGSAQRLGLRPRSRQRRRNLAGHRRRAGAFQGWQVAELEPRQRAGCAVRESEERHPVHQRSRQGFQPSRAAKRRNGVARRQRRLQPELHHLLAGRTATAVVWCRHRGRRAGPLRREDMAQLHRRRRLARATMSSCCIRIGRTIVDRHE